MAEQQPILFDAKTEIWRPIPGLEAYAVSCTGNVRRIKPGKGARVGVILRPAKDHCGYEFVALYHNGKQTLARVHRLVASAFLPADAARKFVNHKNGVRADNRVENLEWCTHSENIKHSFDFLGQRTGGAKGEANRLARLTDDAVREIRKAREGGETYAAIARRYGVAEGTIGQVCLRTSWKHIT